MAVEFWESSNLTPLESLLNALSQPGNRGKEFLKLRVDADEGLVEGDNASTWLQISSSNSSRIA